ncbi:ATP-binding protein [Maribacter sp. 2307ULW6-5]|uniref:tetratricopeptide repeat-containing sensor histidine kinase n=1 Tax=Maribacter sp. 2307ULW6-5 TaxID=3386275 RepID=UPI0039BC8485
MAHQHTVALPHSGFQWGPEDIVRIDSLNQIAEQLRYSGPKNIKQVALEALKLSEAIDYNKGRLFAHYHSAVYELYQGNWEQALSIHKRNMERPGFYDFPELVLKTYNDMAQAHFINSDYPKSYGDFLVALEHAEASGNLSQQFRIRSNLGTMFLLLKDFDEAGIHYGRAESILDQVEDSQLQSVLLVNIGVLHIERKDYEGALPYLMKGTALSANRQETNIAAFGQLTLGRLHTYQGDYEKAMTHLNLASIGYTASGDKKGLADLAYGMGAAQLGLGEYEKARKQILKSLALFKAFSLKSGMERCYRMLYKIAKAENAPAASLGYLELAEAYSDSIAIEQNKNNLAMLRTKLAYENEKELLRRQDEEFIEKQNAYIRVITAGMVISLCFALLIHHQGKRNRKMNLMLAEKTKALTEREIGLEKTNRTKDKLFSIIGHDLRGPILSLKELVGLSLEEDPNGNLYFKRFGPDLNTKLGHLQFTLDNLLNWGQNQMQGAITRPREVPIKTQIDHILDFFLEKIERKNIKVCSNVAEETTVYADEDHFRILLRNLISNAIKFTHPGGNIEVRAQQKYGKTTIEVKDDGLGMKPDVLQRILNSQEHISTVGTNMEKGTGLGLLLCTDMVQQNKGEITVASKPGQGSIFKVSLPSKKGAG